ncbi:MAG: helix-turn-helix domain-containing protein [Candidatus Aminicenantaceae bacterium]
MSITKESENDEILLIGINIDLKAFLNSLERAILVKMLDRFNGNQKDTATFLGVNHTTLNQKVRKHKISFFKRPIEG